MIGVVLAGGKSARLGQDKTQLVHGGQTLLQRAIGLLGRHCSQVYVSCRHPEKILHGVPVITDTTKRVGPLGGIVSCLQQLNTPILVLACDLPFMKDEYLQELIQARNSCPGHFAVTAWQEHKSIFFQSLVAIYEPMALALLEKGLLEKNYKLNDVIPANLRHILNYPTSEAQVFFNINRPEDLARLHQSQPCL